MISENEYKAIIGENLERSPIWFVNMHGSIKTAKSRKIKEIYVRRIGIKGTFEQIRKDPTSKKRFLMAYFKGYPNPAKKVKDFNLDFLTIGKIEIIHFSGYGVKL